MDRGPLLAFAGVVAFGGMNGVAIAHMNEELPPLWGAALRFGAASLLLFGIAAVQRVRFPRDSALFGSLIYGVLYFAIGFGLIHWALVAAPPGMTQIILSVVPLLALGSAVLHRVEPLRWQGLAGAILAVVGVSVVFADRIGTPLPVIVVVAILGGAAAIAEGTVAVKRFPGSHPVAGNAIAMGAGGILLFGASLIAGEPWFLPEAAGSWLSLSYVTVVGSVVVFVLFLYVVSRWTASAASYMWPLLPLVAVPFSAVVAGERVTPLVLVGGVLVVLGVYVGAVAPATRPSPAPLDARGRG